MADAVNPWNNFFNNNNNTNLDDDDGIVPEGDELDGAEEEVTDAQKEYEEYLKAENTVVTKVIMTFAPIFKSFIDEAIKNEE